MNEPDNTGDPAGIIAGRPTASAVGQEARGLAYRGYAIEDLAAQAVFEEVAFLLIHGELPTSAELDAFLESLISRRTLPAALKTELEKLPADTHPTDVLRTGCSILGALEPETRERGQVEIAHRLLALFPAMLLYWHHYRDSGSRLDTEAEIPGVAAYFFQLLHLCRPQEIQTRALDVSLILYADDEFTPATFASRTAASTQADFYSRIAAAIGALGGPARGDPAEAAINFIRKFGTPQEAEAGILAMLKNDEVVTGFGHPVRDGIDPRAEVIESWSRVLSEVCGDELLPSVAQRIAYVMRREKGLVPSLEYRAAVPLHLMGIPPAMFTPVFVISRITGWAAHIFEQREGTRLIHPTARRVGPPTREFVPMEKRGKWRSEDTKEAGK